MNNKNLILKLKKLQEELIMKERTFPECCTLSGMKIYKEFDFPIIAGFVLTKNGPKKHTWNEINSEKIVDLSLFQFQKDYSIKVPKIILLEKRKAQKIYGYFKSSSITENVRKFIASYNKPFFEYPDFDNFKL